MQYIQNKTMHIKETVRKGHDPDMDSYSAFFDNDRVKSTELPKILEELGATDLYICGLAYDVCVFASCMDGLRLGYRLVLVENCARGVDPKGIIECRQQLIENGGLIIKSDEVKDYMEGNKRSLVMALKGAQAIAVRRQIASKEE